MEADGEWSDGSDDALRSGSATDIAPSDGEELNNEEKKIAATNRLLKTDPVNAILDKIDAELGAMNGKSVLMQPKSSISKGNPKSEDKQQKKSIPVSLSERETLTTSKLNSKEERVKEGDHCPSDLDSVAAEQIDEKFKEIMKKKRGGFLEDLSKQQSDNETIRTEDFENKFKSALIHDKACQCGCLKNNRTKKLVSFSDQLITNGKPPSGKKKGTDDVDQTMSSRIQQKTLPVSPPSRNICYASDLESVQTEDFESKFSDLMIRDPMGKSSLQPVRSQTPALPSSSVGKPSILQQQQPNQSAISERHLTEKKYSERKIQFLENGHVHSPLDPVLKKSESSPRRMLSDYGRSTPTPAVGSNTNEFISHSLFNGHSANPSFNGLTQTSSMGQTSSKSASPTINGALPASNGTIPAFSRSLPVTSPKHSSLKPTCNKTLKRLNRQLSWDGSSGLKSNFDCQTTGDSNTIFEENSLTSSSFTETASSTDSLTSANSFKRHFLPSSANNPLVSRQSSITSASSGYIAELEDSVYDPLSRSPSVTDVLLENDQDNKDGLTLENVFDRVLTWNNDPGSQSGSVQSSFNTNEVDNKMKSVLSDSDFSSVSTSNKVLILPEEDSTGISFSKHSRNNKSSTSDSSVQFSTESSAYSDTSNSLYDKQHSVSLPNIASAGSAGIFPGLSPPLQSFSSQERVSYGNFAMINPMMQHVPSAAESVLLNLGFGESGRCLPQRFMNSWYEKLAKAQAEQQEFLMRQQLQKTCLSNVQNVYFHNSNPSEASKDTSQSKVTLESYNKPLLRYPSVPNLKNKLQYSESKCRSSVKHTRLARLREYVESHAGLLKVGLSGVDCKRKKFSDSRQQSLPINLETLNEEEEINPQREKHEVNQNSLFKDFLKEEGLSDANTSLSDSDSSYDCKKQDQKIELDKVHELHNLKEKEKGNEHCKAKTSSNVSSDSLEVASIMKPTQIEPAMVSIILQDVDGNIQMTSPISLDKSDTKLLNIPLSPSISSPLPQSPVTVIEVGLDNQFDSLDVEDATPILNEVNGEQEEEPELKRLVDHLYDEELDAECSSLQLSTSPENSPSPLPSPLNLSPNLQSGSSPPPYEDSSSGIQADDGSLTPLQKLQDSEVHLEVVQDLGDEFYLVKEERVQCVDVGCQYEPQPADRIKYPLFRNKLLTVGSSDSDSQISDCRNLSPILTVRSRCSISPPIHQDTARNRFLLKGDKYALSDSEIHKSSSERKQMFLNSPALVLTNENGEDNDLDPDSNTNLNSHFKPIYSSMESSIGSDDDQYLITKPRPRRCSRHKRSLMYSDKIESDFSNSDDSVFIQPKTRKFYKCDSVEQECQTDQNFIPDSLSSSSPSPCSRYDQDIPMDRCSLSSLVDQCTQTIQEVSECKEIQTDTKTNSVQCVQTDRPVRTAEAFCQTQMPPLVQSRETQTVDANKSFVQKRLSENSQTRFTSTANFTLRNQFNASPTVPNGNGAFVLHQNSLSPVSSSECSSVSDISSENGSYDFSYPYNEKHDNPQIPRTTWSPQIENEMPQKDEDYDIFKTFEETCSSPADHPDSLISGEQLDNPLHVQDDEIWTSSRRFVNPVVGELADSPCNSRHHNYIGSSEPSENISRKYVDIPIFEVNLESQSWSSDCSATNHINNDYELNYMNQNGCSGIQHKSSDNVERISETVCNTGSFKRSCEQYESDNGVFEMIESDGHMDDKDQLNSNHIYNRLSKSSFRSSRNLVDSGFYESPCNSSDDLMNKRVSNILHGTTVSKNQFDKRVMETIAKKPEDLLGNSGSQIINKVSKTVSKVSEDEAVGTSNSSTREQIAKVSTETPSLVLKHQFKSTIKNKIGDNLGHQPVYQERVLETLYQHKQGATQYKDSDIPYSSHLYHVDNQVSQTRPSKENINIWVSEAPYIIRPEQNSMLNQLKRSCSGRRSYRRKSVKALAYLFDNKY